MAGEPQGRFLGLPYNWRRPRSDGGDNNARDRDDDRILRPKRFGWGYGVNFPALSRRLRGR